MCPGGIGHRLDLGRIDSCDLAAVIQDGIKIPPFDNALSVVIALSVFPHLHLVWTDSQFLEILRTTHQSCFCHTLISTYFR